MKPFKRLGTYGAMNPRRGVWKLKPKNAEATAPATAAKWSRDWWRNQVIDWAFSSYDNLGEDQKAAKLVAAPTWRERVAIRILNSRLWEWGR